MSSTISFDDKQEFAEFVAAKARAKCVHLVLCHGDGKEYREELLKCAGRWPSGQLAKIDKTHAVDVSDALQHTQEDANERIASLRLQLASITDALFSVNAQSKPGRRFAAVQTLRAYVAELQQDEQLWSKLESPTKFALSFPLRKKREMQQLLHLLGQDVRAVWGDAVERVFQVMQVVHQDAQLRACGVAAANDARDKARDRALSKAFRSLLEHWSSRRSPRQLTLTPSQEGGRIRCRVEETASTKWENSQRWTRDRPTLSAGYAASARERWVSSPPSSPENYRPRPGPTLFDFMDGHSSLSDSDELW